MKEVQFEEVEGLLPFFCASIFPSTVLYSLRLQYILVFEAAEAFDFVQISGGVKTRIVRK